MDQTGEKSAPPYISFTTFLGLLDKMREGIVPRKLDPTYLKSYAGGTQPKILQAFRYLGLTDKENVVQPPLRDLVGQPEQRRALLTKMLDERYPWAMALTPDATEQDLLDAFKVGSGIEGETRRKAVTFFLNAAEAAGIELSPLFRKTRGRPAGSPNIGGVRRPTLKRVAKGAKRTQPNGGSPDQEAEGKPLAPATTKDEMTAAYFAMLLEKAKSGQKVDPELANRMERVLGFAPEVEAPSKSAGRKKLIAEPASTPDAGASPVTEETS